MPNPPDGPGFEFLTLDPTDTVAKQQLDTARTQGWQVDAVYVEKDSRVALLEYGYNTPKKAKR